MRPYAVTTATSGASALSFESKSVPLMRSGCHTGTPRACAATFTGGGCSCCPRPFGRSGCVTTATTSPRRKHASSDGTAKSGVPMKTSRGTRRPYTRSQPAAAQKLRSAAIAADPQGGY
jgi:hypothetical protein